MLKFWDVVEFMLACWGAFALCVVAWMELSPDPDPRYRGESAEQKALRVEREKRANRRAKRETELYKTGMTYEAAMKFVAAELSKEAKEAEQAYSEVSA